METNKTRGWFFEKIKGRYKDGNRKCKNIFRSYYRSVYSTKLENLDEMDNFLDRYQVPKLNHDQTNYLNIPISPKEIEAAIKSLPTKKSTRPDGFIPIFFKVFHKIETEGTLSKLF